MQQDLDEQEILQLALDKVVSRKQQTQEYSLEFDKNYRVQGGKDIVKKSVEHKNRVLMVFNCQIQISSEGRLGQLTNIDSQNPIFYVDFPQGRAKMFGTLVYPQNKYLVLKTGLKSSILCEDVYESMIVFSKTEWIGDKNSNPLEKPLPWPDEVQSEKQFNNYDKIVKRQKEAKPDLSGSQTLKQNSSAMQQSISQESQISDKDLKTPKVKQKQVMDRPQRTAAKRLKYDYSDGSQMSLQSSKLIQDTDSVIEKSQDKDSETKQISDQSSKDSDIEEINDNQNQSNKAYTKKKAKSKNWSTPEKQKIDKNENINTERRSFKRSAKDQASKKLMETSFSSLEDTKGADSSPNESFDDD